MALDGKLDVVCVSEAGRTVLRHLYCTPPFKVMKPFRDGRGGLELLVLECSPGILEGDRQTVHIELAADARLRVTGQSYGKLFTMREGEAVQQVTLTVAAGATLVYLPEPMVPFHGARFRSSQQVQLARGAQLFWAEMITPGRLLQGEVFRYSLYQSQLEVVYDGELIYWDHLRLEPDKQPLQGLGLFEEETHYAQVVLIGVDAVALAAHMAAWQEQAALPHVPLHAASSALHGGVGAGVRVLGRSAEAVKAYVHRLADWMDAKKEAVC